ncbi:MAG TPA: hypothetical protein VFN11_12120 [Ktedonobacterales bacterium]|nr:hypothetical protein [Ktedonobacterales bacterium]
MTTMDNEHGHGDANDEQDLEDDSEFDPAEYNTMLQLERLESLEEEMTELGVTTLDEIRRRIGELNIQLDMERKG